MKTYLESEEIKLLELSATNPRDCLLIRLLYRLGCRVSEALALTVEDVDLQKRMITIQHLKTRLKLTCPHCNAKLAAGEIHSINDLITYNLDLRQFAQDVIETCEGPDLLRAFYQSIAEVSVLDPTCGSGAFLFAALNILEPLYEACLERMEVFVEELDKSGEKHHPEKFSDFCKVLEQANDITKHPSRVHFAGSCAPGDDDYKQGTASYGVYRGPGSTEAH